MTDGAGRRVPEGQPVRAQTNLKGFQSSREGEDFIHPSTLNLLPHIP